MAHFAELDPNNIVLRVIVVSNTELDADGVESEQKGIDFCQSLLGGVWVQTSYNSAFRKNFASVGDTYDTDRDAFIPPQPSADWSLNDVTCRWELLDA